MARLQAALDGLGLDGSHRLIVVLMQLVNLLQDGKPVRMSKRSGKAIALHDLLDEVSVDAARYFFNSRSATSPVDFDLDLAVREDSENPVYYVQYAHARICTLVAPPGGGGRDAVPKAAGADPRRAHDHRGGDWPSSSTLAQSARGDPRWPPGTTIPSRINRYLTEPGRGFPPVLQCLPHHGARSLPILAARLKLADTVRAVLANGLGLLGVSAPEKM